MKVALLVLWILGFTNGDVDLASMDADKLVRLGRELIQQGQYKESHMFFFRAVQLDPSPENWNLFRQSYELEGNPEGVHLDLGMLQLRNSIESGNSAMFTDAVRQFEQALQVNPNSAAAHLHLFQAYSLSNDKLKSKHHLSQAIALEPNNAATLYTMGTLYFADGDFDNALHEFERSADIDPMLGPAVGNRFYMRKRVCKWDDFQKGLDDVEKLALRELADPKFLQMSVHPYQAVSYAIDPVLKLRIAQRFAQKELASAIEHGLTVRTHSPATRKHHRRLRVAYISTDFRLKATAYLIQNMFGYHDREKYQIFCFALTADDGSLWRRRISSQCENFIDISRNSLKTIVSLIHDKYNIDILIDMDGYCNEGIRKTEILAAQPAPIQMHLLVYPGPMGAPFIQYFVGDPHTTPPELYHTFSEKLLVMPNSYFINSHRSLFHSSQPLHGQEIVSADSLLIRDEIRDGVVYNAYGETAMHYGLPRRKFVFCSFNSHYKFDPNSFTIWMNLLKQVEGSVLWLLRFPKESEPRIRKEAAARKVDSYKQIVFSEYINDPERNLRRLRFADILLDTFNYGAHTGCADALYAGVPVVTVAGNQFAARVCTGQLRTIGLGHLVADTPAEYASIALSLATDRTKLTRRGLTWTQCDKRRRCLTLSCGFDTLSGGSAKRGSCLRRDRSHNTF
eukprot:c14205_g1_i1.p1 GENE.c14205_g1_i1~~c14205_g1_i1.p1  ORF type:complete len:680 (+),score=135.21 c14205_g1_i1:42-2081(+)